VIVFQVSLLELYRKIKVSYRIVRSFFLDLRFSNINFSNTLENITLIGPGSLTICLITAFFIGMVFTLQVAKEFLYLDAINLIGAVLTIAFVRELSPVLTSVIIIGRIGSAFTAELATMRVTDQIDALYLLGVNPLFYLIFPRIFACICITPMLNLISFATSLASSSFICFTIYDITPVIFFSSAFASLSILDLFKSLLKTVVFGFVISLVSCVWGITAKGGAKGVGKATTSSVVFCLLSVFVIDFIMSYLMFNKLESAIKTL